RPMNQPRTAARKTRRQGDKETRRGGDPQVERIVVNSGTRNCQANQTPARGNASRGKGSSLLVSLSPPLPLSPSPCLAIGCSRARSRSAVKAGLRVRELKAEISV